MRVAFCVLALLGVSAPAVAKDAVNAQGAAKERKVCRNAEQSTGSIMAKRVCRTKDDWAALDAAHAAETERFKMNENVRNGSASGAPRGQ